MSLYRRKQFWDRLIGEEWSSSLFPNVLNTDNMEDIMDTVDSIYTLSKTDPKLQSFPKKKDIFKAFKLCPRDKLKFVVLGQDPYKNKKATGLAFANPKDTPDRTISPSLGVIMDALERSYPGEGTNMDKSLEFWAEQGVLLLNTSLTVGKSALVTHSSLWRDFIDGVLKEVTANGSCPVILLGKDAKSFTKSIHDWTDIVRLPHPSFCAREGLPLNLDFIGYNKFLINIYGKGITWIDTPPFSSS